MTDKEFGRLQKALSLIGNVNIGGVTGNQLAGKINRDLGIEIIGAFRSIQTGESPDVARKAVADELKRLEEQAQQASNEEKALRTEQIGLLQLQTSILQDDKQFYAEQLKLTNDIANSNTDLLKVLGDLNKISQDFFDRDYYRIKDIEKEKENSITARSKDLDEKIKGIQEQKNKKEGELKAKFQPDAPLSKIEDEIRTQLRKKLDDLKETYRTEPNARKNEEAHSRALDLEKILKDPAQIRRIALVEQEGRKRGVTEGLDSESYDKKIRELQDQKRDIRKQEEDKFTNRHSYGPPLLPEEPIYGPPAPSDITSKRKEKEYSVPKPTEIMAVPKINPAPAIVLPRYTDEQRNAINENYRKHQTPYKNRANYVPTEQDKLDHPDLYLSLDELVKRNEDQKKKVNPYSNNNVKYSSDIGQADTGDEQKSLTETLQKLTSSFDLFKNLEELKNISDGITSLNDVVSGIKSLLEKMGQSVSVDHNLTIAPIQVNVALTAPDILSMAGPALQASILEAVGEKLAQVFSNDPETAGKIKGSFA